MAANPILGVFFHWLGGLASGSFYVPYRGVKKWSWETYWLVGGFFSWIIAPWVLGFIMVPHLTQILHETPMRTLWWAYFFGAMWGLGGLTFGLTMRYLGMSLGMAVALGYCAAFGTIMPPLFLGDFVETTHTTSGHIILIGIVVCLTGIVIAGMAGMSKEREMPEEQKKATIKEFSFTKGILVATFSGVMSASMSYGLTAAEPIAKLALAHGATPIWTGLPKLVVVLLGGFTSNFIWCALLNIKNRSAKEYFTPYKAVEASAALDSGNAGGSGGGTAVATAVARPAVQVESVPMLSNYLFSALAGTTWYMQFFFYTMGETQMGQFKFSSWTLHMASIIIFSTLWGIALHEWKGSSKKTHKLIALGLAVLIASTLIVGYGNYRKPIKGELLEMDGSRLLVKGDGNERLTIPYTKDISVSLEGTAGKLSDLKVGQTILVETTQGEVKTATAVLVRLPKGK